MERISASNVYEFVRLWHRESKGHTLSEEFPVPCNFGPIIGFLKGVWWFRRSKVERFYLNFLISAAVRALRHQIDVVFASFHLNVIIYYAFSWGSVKPLAKHSSGINFYSQVFQRFYVEYFFLSPWIYWALACRIPPSSVYR